MSFNQIVTVLDAVSKIGILITLITLYINMRQTRRLNYIACTAKYTRIQEIFLSNKNLAALHLRIYHDQLPQTFGAGPEFPEDERTTAEKLNEELALSAMLFQLMEDVWTVNLERRNSWFLSPEKRRDNEAIYEGWDNLFRDWMATPEIGEKWNVLKRHYNSKFVTDTESRYRATEH
jgi:hypothetical protein